MSKLLVEQRGAITVLTLNRPDVHNNVDRDLAVALAEAIGAFADDDEAAVLVLTGAGDKAFCAGANLKGTPELFNHPYTHSAGPMGFARLDPGKPTIAAVNGYCFAGGLELALWCDFRIAAANAQFGVLNVRWGVSLADGGTQRLPRIVGQGNALWMVETGVQIDAQRALGIGLVQEVVAGGGALARSLDLAEHVATYPQGGIRADRQAVLGTYGLDLHDGLLMEERVAWPAVSSSEATAGMASFVAGERPQPPRPA